jgi:hypothetical protein
VWITSWNAEIFGASTQMAHASTTSIHETDH